MNAANLHDLRRGERLFVGNHGQGFQRRQRELHRRIQVLYKRANRFVMLRLGGHLVSAGQFANGQSVLGTLVFGYQLVEKPPDQLHRFPHRTGHLDGRERLVRHVDNSFQDSQFSGFFGDGR